jgi:hypothetical protein
MHESRFRASTEQTQCASRATNRLGKKVKQRTSVAASSFSNAAKHASEAQRGRAPIGAV